jgi:hypothetical protein
MYNLNLLVDTLLPLRLIEGIPTIVPYGTKEGAKYTNTLLFITCMIGIHKGCLFLSL